MSENAKDMELMINGSTSFHSNPFQSLHLYPVVPVFTMTLQCTKINKKPKKEVERSFYSSISLDFLNKSLNKRIFRECVSQNCLFDINGYLLNFTYGFYCLEIPEQKLTYVYLCVKSKLVNWWINTSWLSIRIQKCGLVPLNQEGFFF